MGMWGKLLKTRFLIAILAFWLFGGKSNTFRVITKFWGHLGHILESFTYQEAFGNRRRTWRAHIGPKKPWDVGGCWKNNIRGNPVSKNVTFPQNSKFKMMPLEASIHPNPPNPGFYSYLIRFISKNTKIHQNPESLSRT